MGVADNVNEEQIEDRRFWGFWGSLLKEQILGSSGGHVCMLQTVSMRIEDRFGGSGGHPWLTAQGADFGGFWGSLLGHHGCVFQAMSVGIENRFWGCFEGHHGHVLH